MVKTVPIREELSSAQLEAIRVRAYELYEARGQESGRELDDWLQAKQEVMSGVLAQTAAAGA